MPDARSPGHVVPAKPARNEPDLLILASASPRRRTLLESLGVPFRVIASEAPESLDGSLDPETQAVALALRKARAVAARLDPALVLGADTIVALDDDVLGKPRDDADAVHMLRALSGRSHVVVTGLALIDVGAGEEGAAAVSSTVRFRFLNDDTIARYVASGEPRDKAGAYAIQELGAALIAGFEGCFTNVVGLPLCETALLLQAAGVPLSTAGPVCRLPDGAPCPRAVRRQLDERRDSSFVAMTRPRYGSV